MKKYTSMLRKEDTDKKWLEVNAEGIVLGRLATQIAMILMGKTKANYTPHVDNGDFVIVTNAEKIIVTGNKLQDKKYYNHSGFPGGLRTRSLDEVLTKNPEEVLYEAVRRSFQRASLGRT